MSLRFRHVINLFKLRELSFHINLYVTEGSNDFVVIFVIVNNDRGM